MALEQHLQVYNMTAWFCPSSSSSFRLEWTVASSMYLATPVDEGLAILEVCVKVDLINDGARRRLDARLLVGQGKLVQDVDVGERVGQSHLFRHGALVKFSSKLLSGLKMSI
jgi:hypothetical protein